MKHKIILIAVFMFAFVVIQAQNAENKHLSKAHPKYVFLFIGDGMGLAQANAAEAYKAVMNGKTGIEKLNFSKFPVQSFATTYAGDRYITCSAAAGTALASGFKTSINTIGMDLNRKKSLESVATKAKKKGMKVGIITTVSLNHATPAAFYAHQPDRNNYYEIACEMPVSKFDFFGGGALKDSTGKKGDKQNAIGILQDSGYKIVRTKRAFEQLNKTSGKVYAINPEYGKESEMPQCLDRTSGSLSLADFTGKAIELLENPKGFFMMIEGGQIDWACHNNDAASEIQEVYDFDAAIAKAIAFMNKHPKETLIIVTADHETGGMAMGYTEMKYESDFKLLSNQKVSVAGLEILTKASIAKNNDLEKGFPAVLKVLEQNLEFGSAIKLNTADSLMLKTAFLASGVKLMPFPTPEANKAFYGGIEPVASTAVKILNHKAGIGWTNWSHTGIPVPVRATGAGQDWFEGYLDNTDIPNNIIKLMGL
jgi:alkaline phosphatase